MLPELVSITNEPDNITSTGVNATANILEKIADVDQITPEVYIITELFSYIINFKFILLRP